MEAGHSLAETATAAASTAGTEDAETSWFWFAVAFCTRSRSLTRHPYPHSFVVTILLSTTASYHRAYNVCTTFVRMLSCVILV
jgi:hypothetical protein